MIAAYLSQRRKARKARKEVIIFLSALRAFARKILTMSYIPGSSETLMKDDKVIRHSLSPA
jgi:hypothetical protein